MPTMTVEGNTDQNGDLRETVNYNPPGPFDLRVSLAATLLEPANTTVEGELDIDAADGSPSNERKRFVLATGQQTQLGSWRFDSRENIIILTGKTNPPRPNTKLVVEIEASLNYRTRKAGSRSARQRSRQDDKS
jgi:hypothetical protein